MKKIVIDARESGTSTGRYIDKLIEYLASLDTGFKFVILTKSHRIEPLQKLAPKFVIIASDYKEFTFAEQLGFNLQLRKLKPDLIHFGKTEQPVLYRGKSVTTIHDLINALMHNPSRYRNPLYFKFKQLVYRWVIRRVSRKSKIIITPSIYVKKQLAAFSHINPAKILVTYESADLIDAKPEEYAPAKNKQFIMYVGRPTLHKNLGRLIDTFVILQRARPELYLVLVGKTDANYLGHAERIKNEKISNVLFTDFIPDSQLKWLYQNCSVYAFPSLSEGFGLPGLEAMIHGAPVVSSNATCLPEIYGDAAHYFDPTNGKDMASKITEVLDNLRLHQELVKKGYSQAKKYSWQRMAEQTLEVYKKALEN